MRLALLLPPLVLLLSPLAQLHTECCTALIRISSRQNSSATALESWAAARGGAQAARQSLLQLPPLRPLADIKHQQYRGNKADTGCQY